MFTTIKNKFARIILAAAIVLILSSGPITGPAYAEPTCGATITEC